MDCFGLAMPIARIARWLALLAAPLPPRKYPDQPVRIIVPFAAGGPTDVVARLIGQKLSEKLGQQFVIENIAGAGGNIGMGNAARARPTATRSCSCHRATWSTRSSTPRRHTIPYKDFVPLTWSATSPIR